MKRFVCTIENYTYFETCEPDDCMSGHIAPECPFWKELDLEDHYRPEYQVPCDNCKNQGIKCESCVWLIEK